MANGACTQLDVVVIGAGMGGLGAAICIADAGHKVTIVEQAPDFVEVLHVIVITIAAHRLTTMNLVDWRWRSSSPKCFEGAHTLGFAGADGQGRIEAESHQLPKLEDGEATRSHRHVDNASEIRCTILAGLPSGLSYGTLPGSAE